MMGSRGRLAVAVTLAAVVLLPCGRASAVVLSAGDGTGNTTAPPADPGWGIVGSLNGASGIYLGSGWVLTARHVGGGTITFGGLGSFSAVANSTRSIRNPDSSLSDLVLFRLTSAPALPELTIASSLPGDGSELLMIGIGRNRESEPTMWSIDDTTGAWTETTNPLEADRTGYAWIAGRTKRWGTNVLDDDATTDVELSNGTTTRDFATLFSGDGDDPLTHEAQAAAGDSGGAVFFNGELVGMMHAISLLDDQPGETTVFGQSTFSADLSFYRSQILSIIPEPAGATALVAPAALVLLRRRRSLPSSSFSRW